MGKIPYLIMYYLLLTHARVEAVKCVNYHLNCEKSYGKL